MDIPFALLNDIMTGPWLEAAEAYQPAFHLEDGTAISPIVNGHRFHYIKKQFIPTDKLPLAATKSFPDVFQENQKDATQSKLRVNQQFIDLLLSHPRHDREIVYLDSNKLQTTRFLRLYLHRIDPSKLHVPNPKWQQIAPLLSQPRPQNKSTIARQMNLDSDSSSDSDSDSKSNPEIKLTEFFEKPIYEQATLYPMTLYEWIRDASELNSCKQYDWGLDYCCTWNGNMQVKPQVDLKLIVSLDLIPREGGILWLTICTRSCHREQIVKSIHDFMLMLGLEHNIQFNCKHSDHYQNMIYFLWVTSPITEQQNCPSYYRFYNSAQRKLMRSWRPLSSSELTEQHLIDIQALSTQSDPITLHSLKNNFTRYIDHYNTYTT